MPNLMDRVNVNTKSIQNSMQFIGTKPMLDVASSMRLIQQQAQGLRQSTRPVHDEVSRTKLRTRAVTITPKQRIIPRTTPPPFPALLIPPWEAIRPRRKPKVKKDKKKTRIWWYVPSQPLGEAWSPTEYVVFKTKTPPAYVKRREQKKKMDYDLVTQEDDQRMFWDDSVF